MLEKYVFEKRGSVIKSDISDKNSTIRKVYNLEKENIIEDRRNHFILASVKTWIVFSK